jgi:hypothetical protein
MHEPRRAPPGAREPYLATLVAGVRDAWRRPVLRWIFLYSAVIGAGAAGPLLLLQQPWLAEHGVPTAQLGLWQASAHAAEVVAALFAVRVLARLGERVAFLALPFVLSLSGVALAGIEGAWVSAAFLGVALARGMHEPALAGYVNRRIASERRATVLSAKSVAGNVVMAVAWPIAGLVADGSGLRGAFLGYAAGTALLAGVALALWSRAARDDAAHVETGAPCPERVRVR